MPITKEHLSEGDGDGEPIAVAATSSPGTTVHTAHATSKDEVHLYLSSIHTSPVTVIVEFGGVDTKNRIAHIIQPNETICAVPGVCLGNSKLVKVYAGTTNVVNAFGWVNRIS